MSSKRAGDLLGTVPEAHNVPLGIESNFVLELPCRILV